jgi:nucleotide-binding universal stress UspA family protein
MAKRILVPLDGSTTAEAVLSLVASGAGAAVKLLHVAPIPENQYGKDGYLIAYADQEIARLEAQHLDYLATVEAGLGSVPVERAVRFGDPVREILQEAEEWGADLIAVTTAGHSGLGRLVLGSVAEQVFRKAVVPVVLYHAGRERSGRQSARRPGAWARRRDARATGDAHART